MEGIMGVNSLHRSDVPAFVVGYEAWPKERQAHSGASDSALWRHYRTGELILPRQVPLRLRGTVMRGNIQVSIVQAGRERAVAYLRAGDRLDTGAWFNTGFPFEFRAVEPSSLYLSAVDDRVLTSDLPPPSQPEVVPATTTGRPMSRHQQRRLAATLLATVLLLAFAAWFWRTPGRVALSRLTYGLAAQHMDRGQLTQAARILEASLEIDPQLGRAYNDLGVIHSRQGRPDEAREAFQKALALDPSSGVAANNLGLSYLDREQISPAVNALERAASLDPEMPVIWANMGTAHLLAGRPDEAARAYRAALRLDPNLVAARVNLGLLLYDQREDAEARKHLQAALQAQPDLARARMISGAIALAEGDAENAWQDLQAASESLAGDPLLHFYLALWYEKAHKPIEAQRELNRVLTLAPHPDLAALTRSHLAALSESGRGTPHAAGAKKGE
jgi:Tfp pilus assembly protein PilF